MADETFRYDILVNAKASIRELREMSKTAADNNERIVAFSSFLVEKSKQWNVPLKQLLNTFKQLNAEMAKAKGQSIFGNVGGKNIISETEKFIKSALTGGRFQLNTEGVVSSLKKISVSSNEAKQSIQAVRAELIKLQQAGKLSLSGMSKQGAVDYLKNIISSVSKTTGAQYGEVGKVLQQMGVPAAQAQAAVRGLNKELTHGVKEASGFRHGIDLIRTALGTLTAVGIFQFLSFLTEGFQTAVKAARELEDSMFRLANTERILSEAGTEISMGGLKKGIQEIKELFPIFSEEDITQLVAQVAIATKEFGFTEEQILETAKAIAVLNIRSTQEETATQTAQAVLGAMITDNAKGISNLSLSFKEMELQAKAVSMELLQAGESADKLTSEEKAQVKYALLLENTNKELGNLGDYMDTNTAKLKQNSASWHDLLTSIGSIFTAITPLLSPFLEFIQDGVNGFKAMLVIVQATETAVQKLVASVLTAVEKLRLGFSNPQEFVENIRKAFTEGFQGDFQEGLGDITKFFPTMPANAPDWFKDIFGEFLEEGDTLTAPINNFQNALDSIDTDKAADALEDMLKKLEDLQNKMAEKEADFGLKLERFDKDALMDEQRAIEDYNLNVLQTQRQFALRRKEMEDKYRQREVEDERRFQEQMRQLREKFLYNLEDALRERDARQVLRLIDQYNMEKQAMINENNLRRQSNAENHRQEMDDLKAQEEERLRVMAEEHALKMQRMEEDSNLKRARMEEDHAIEIQRMKEQTAKILEEAAYKIAQEYGLNEEGAQALYNLLNQYYGSSGALATLTANGYNSMLMQAQGFLAQVAAVIGQYQGMLAGAASATGAFMNPIPLQQSQTTGGGSIRSGRGIPQFAAGGQFVATRAMPIMVGEGGESELVTVTPLSKLGSLRGGKQPINGADGLNGRNGETKIMLDMNLSPDLEARVVRKSMDSTAEIVQRINRSKR